MKKIIPNLIIFTLLSIPCLSQNIGINKANPQERLDVNGNVRADTVKTMSVKIPINAGLNKVLTSDANGIGTWNVLPSFGGSLDSAYNYGGLGLGRTITANYGPVLINGTDGFQVTGLNTTGADLTLSGAGTKMFFYPKKSAFRAGITENEEWDKDSVGIYSFSGGNSTKAKGVASTAFGFQNSAIGGYSFASGNNSIASGNYANAGGERCISNGPASFAINSNTTANGYYATSLGYYTKANGNGSLVIGSYNDTIVGVESSFGVDDPLTPLFIIGNGTSSQRKNAMVVNYNGYVGIGTNYPSSRLEVKADNGPVLISGTDGLNITGTYGSGTNLALSGPGSKMFFYPKKAAFRAGYVSLAHWNNDSIGNYSFAGGYNPKAIGDYSVAFGASANAIGLHSVALGYNASALGHESFAMGFGSKAIGINSIAMGQYSEASGAYATAIGRSVNSNAYNAFVIGSYNNDTIGTTSSWVTSDPLFVIANGSSVNNKNNAFVINKSGSGQIDGNFLPAADDSYKLGSVNKRWKEVWSANGVIQTSDEKMKENITNLFYGVNTVMQLRPVKYNWKNLDKSIQLGFLAQEVEKVVPEVVVNSGEEQIMGMKYTELIPVLVKAIQEQQKMIDELREEIRKK